MKITFLLLICVFRRN